MENTVIRNRVFLVDAYPKVEQFIPCDLLEKAEYVTHDVPVDPHMDRAETIAHCEQVARKIYAMYRDEAQLVITSRLHCAAPCIAMGIPTIVVKDSFDERFGWLDKLTHLYTVKEFDNIDWHPEPVDMGALKQQVMAMAISMLRGEPNRELLQTVHDFYMSCERQKLKSPLMVRCYSWLAQYSPRLANFIRTKVLRRFTITAKSGRPNVP